MTVFILVKRCYLKQGEKYGNIKAVSSDKLEFSHKKIKNTFLCRQLNDKVLAFDSYYLQINLMGRISKTLKSVRPPRRENKFYVSSVVEWLKHRAYDQYDLGLKPTCAILLCPWERHIMGFSHAWWTWQAVLN